MAEPFSSSAAGGTALIKFFGIPIVSSAAATTLGFLILWPKTTHEAIVRFLTTFLCSLVAGPLAVVALHAAYPDLFASAKIVAVAAGLPPEFGLVGIAGPVMVLTALPAWWILGALVLWFDKRRGKDIGELIVDAKNTFDEAKGGDHAA